MAKKVKSVVKINIEAGKATPAPPIGPSLAPHGINLMMFCKEYNARTNNPQMLGNIIPATITVFSDNSFTFALGTPPTAQLIRKAAGVQKGSGVPNRNKVGKITKKQLQDIADIKMKDLNAINTEGALKQIAGTARSMGIEVQE
ncbi:MAG TPA: 50S ribosomal protein L11 [Thermoflexales bacterium]|nr:50S ribosomal protein L11 [Thermoflexales bacterium]HQW36164.1 50S ribosomal protein L11 [Thermoflexales bacterium]HQZ22247.1 50S ribosomal protein L11 [Thermoflexales bacterium]HQZ99759.1 50S ribosomal protein L11 [Thermoflexales bacterium]